MLIGTPKPLIQRRFRLNRERERFKPALAFVGDHRYTLVDAQVPRHPPHTYRDAHTDRRDALAHGPAAARAQGK